MINVGVVLKGAHFLSFIPNLEYNNRRNRDNFSLSDVYRKISMEGLF